MSVKLRVIVSELHRELCEKMIEAAREKLDELSAEIIGVTWVPGSLELPIVVQDLLRSPALSADAFVILGMLEQGETRHGHVVGQTVTDALVRLQLEHGFPMAVSIIGPGASKEHANGKAARTAAKAVRVAVRLVQLRDEIASGQHGLL